MEAQSQSNSGASNASDFQPPTQNPQQAPGQVFPEQNGVQEGATRQLLENSNAQIQVPVNPAPERPQVAEAKSSNGALIIAVVIVAILLLSLHLWRRRTMFLTRSVPAETVPEPIEEPAPIAEAASKKPKTTDPKKKAARKAAKKRKRSRK